MFDLKIVVSCPLGVVSCLHILSILLNDFNSPAVKFHGTSGGIEYGGSAELGTDGIPKSIWGQTTTTASGWNLKSRAELSHGLYDFDGEDSGAYVTVEGTNDDADAFVWASGSMSADGGFKPLTAALSLPCNYLFIRPRPRGSVSRPSPGCISQSQYSLLNQAGRAGAAA